MGLSLSVYDVNISYKLTIDSKYTFIQGDSGTGKSVLITLLDSPASKKECEDIELHPLSSIMPVPLNLRLSLLIQRLSEIPDTLSIKLSKIDMNLDLGYLYPHGSRSVKRTCDELCELYYTQQMNLASDKHILYYGDEELSWVRSTGFCRTMQSVKVLFLITFRSKLPSLPSGVNNIYSLENKGGSVVNVPVYSASSISLDTKYDFIKCEDGKSGYSYFKQISSIGSLNGKDKLSDDLNDSSKLNDRRLYLVDLVGLGLNTIKFVTHPKFNAYPMLSFEKMLLDQVGEYADPDIYTASHEQFYILRLSEFIKKQTGLPHNKSRLPICLSGCKKACTHYDFCNSVMKDRDISFYCYKDLYMLLCNNDFNRTNMFD